MSDNAYREWYSDRMASWISENADAYRALRLETWEAMRRVGYPDAIPAQGTLRRSVLDQATMERVRQQQGWPSERAYEAGARLPARG